MDEMFEGCEHLISDLYDYAIQNRIPVVRVDDEIRQQVLKHKEAYLRIRPTDNVYTRVRELNVHVLDYHVRSELEQIAGGKKR